MLDLTRRRLTTAYSIVPTVPLAFRTKVRVAFGLEISDEIPIVSDNDPASTWSFLPTFTLSDPWSQRNLYFFCQGWPEQLLVIQSWCWMVEFRAFALIQIGQFPVHSNQFAELAPQFIDSANYATRGTKYIWYTDGIIKALYYSMEVDLSTDADMEAGLALKKHWDTYLAEFNSNDKVTRKTGRGAFHVSKTWVKAESGAVLLQTTLNTLAILLVLAFFGMISFTWSLILSLFVVLATAIVVSFLIFFVIVIIRWPVGLIEVIAMIYFVGYAVTYSLHIAHKYSCSEGASFEDAPLASLSEDAKIRFRRTSYALTAIGGATLGSAATTVGASFFLVFCTLSIFSKLGTLCMVVSLLSIMTAFGPLPGLLLAYGPQHPGAGFESPARAREQIYGLLHIRFRSEQE